MPFSEANWEYLYGRSETPPTAAEYAWNTRFRHLTVLFGDAAAAVVMQAGGDGGRGGGGSILRTHGPEYEKVDVPGVGFKRRPYVDPEQFRRGEHIPVMDGRYVFKSATSSMTEVANEVLRRNGATVADLRLVLMHQANKRINEFVSKTLGLDE